MKRFLLISTTLLLMFWSAQPQVHAANVLSSLIDMDYSGKADTLTTALIRQFLNQSRGTFWAVPRSQSNRDAESTYIYWQQAHAMDVIIYSYQRIKEQQPQLASNYQRYMKLWYANHANNWYHDDNDPTGFLNEYTDDMCWISLTLLHMSEALEDDKYADTARKLFDDYIEPRGWKDNNGFWGLPWKSNDSGRNACTNSPGCLVAAKLFLKYGEEKYKETAINIYNYQANEMSTKFNNDGRVEDPPLTYTQGTFAEACRQLYHITGETSYMQMAIKVANYLCTSSRCISNGLLRHEGTSMDQSIFKAVAIPYITNIILDEKMTLNYRRIFVNFLLKNAKKLWSNLDLDSFPATYCNYYWGEPFDNTTVASMGAMASGASLMEQVARMSIELTRDETSITTMQAIPSNTNGVYSLNGQLVSNGVSNIQSLPKGIYIVGKKKIAVK